MSLSFVTVTFKTFWSHKKKKKEKTFLPWLMCSEGDVVTGHEFRSRIEERLALLRLRLASVNQYIRHLTTHTLCCSLPHGACGAEGTGLPFVHVHDEHGNSHLQQRVRLLVRFPKICQNVFKFRALHFMSWIFHSLSSDILVSADAGENILYPIRSDCICMHTPCLSLFGAAITR